VCIQTDRTVISVGIDQRQKYQSTSNQTSSNSRAIGVSFFPFSLLHTLVPGFSFPVPMFPTLNVSLGARIRIHEPATDRNPCNNFWPLQISKAHTSQHASRILQSISATRRIVLKVDPFHTQLLNRSFAIGILWFHICRLTLEVISRGKW